MSYKIGDIIKLKTLEKLLLEKHVRDKEITEFGFYLKSNLFISADMFSFLGKKFKIASISFNVFCNNEKGYRLYTIKDWVWDDLCFEREYQLEFEF